MRLISICLLRPPEKQYFRSDRTTVLKKVKVEIDENGVHQKPVLRLSSYIEGAMNLIFLFFVVINSRNLYLECGTECE